MEADTTTRIVTEADRVAENTTQQTPGDQLTWRFTASNVRDFAFATSSGYVWDATRATVSDGAGGAKTVAVHSLYRPGAPNGDSAAEYSSHSIGSSYVGSANPAPAPAVAFTPRRTATAIASAS